MSPGGQICPNPKTKSRCDKLKGTTKSTLLALLGFILLSMALSATAQQSGDFTNWSDGSAITITGYTGPGGAVTIPASIAGLPVTTIGDHAFDTNSDGASVTSVTIPDSVTSIGDSAFEGCGGLANITIPGSVTNIGSYAFAFCALSSVTVPASVTSIGLLAFGASPNLVAITVDAANCCYSSLDGVLFNKSQTTLIQYPGGKAGSYSIPGSAISIGDFAFARCTSLSLAASPSQAASPTSGVVRSPTASA